MRVFSTIGWLLLLPALLAGRNTTDQDGVRAAIVAAVSERLGTIGAVDVEILEAGLLGAGRLSAVPAPGARLGAPMRFLVSAGKARAVRVVARVSVVAGHAVARHAIARDAAITADDVAWREGGIDGALLQQLPTLAEVLSARPKRAVAAGEVLSQAVLARQPLVRAGDEVAITIRIGIIEAHGIGRAASSGFIGDVIRVTRPGSRNPRRARITAPAAVEILQ